MAYKLQLPPSARIHPVVHVSQLKKAIPTNAQVCTGLPNYMLSQVMVYPLHIKQDRLVRRGRKVVPQVLLRWAGLPAECTTWEPLFAMVNAYPSSPAWGHAGTPGGSNVTVTLPTWRKQSRPSKGRTHAPGYARRTCCQVGPTKQGSCNISSTDARRRGSIQNQVTWPVWLSLLPLAALLLFTCSA